MTKAEVSHGGLWAFVLAVGPAFWLTFVEPRMVWADEFNPVEEAVYSIQIELVEMRIEGAENEIRSLVSKEHTIGSLSEEEFFRLNVNRSKLERLKRKLDRLSQ